MRVFYRSLCHLCISFTVCTSSHRSSDSVEKLNEWVDMYNCASLIVANESASNQMQFFVVYLVAAGGAVQSEQYRASQWATSRAGATENARSIEIMTACTRMSTRSPGLRASRCAPCDDSACNQNPTVGAGKGEPSRSEQ